MDQFNVVEIGYEIGMNFVPFLFALCFHELAHGLTAKYLGDNTAERRGRLTLNPAAHADMLGTWILPLSAILFRTHFMFGWAKPVPVDARNLKHPLKDMFWIAAAGPASNIFLALVATILLAVALAFAQEGGVGHALAVLLVSFIRWNVLLAVFNLIPIHPLDGGKVIAPFLPIRWNMWLDQHQSQLAIALMIGVFTVGWVIAIPVQWLSQGLLSTAEALARHLA